MCSALQLCEDFVTLFLIYTLLYHIYPARWEIINNHSKLWCDGYTCRIGIPSVVYIWNVAYQVTIKVGGSLGERGLQIPLAGWR